MWLLYNLVMYAQINAKMGSYECTMQKYIMRVQLCKI